MRAHLVVVSTPSLAFSARLVEAEEPVRVEALGAELAVQAFDESIVGWLAGIHPARAAGRCTWADQPVIAGGLFLVRRALAALRWFAMRPRAYLIGSSSTMLGS